PLARDGVLMAPGRMPGARHGVRARRGHQGGDQESHDQAPHHLDSYRGPSGAGKLPVASGTTIFLRLGQPCQYLSLSLASPAMAAVIRKSPMVAPNMLSRLWSRPSRRP